MGVVRSIFCKTNMEPEKGLDNCTFFEGLLTRFYVSLGECISML